VNSIVEDNNCGSTYCFHSEYWSTSSGWETRNFTGNIFQRNRGTNIVEYANVFGNLAFLTHNYFLDNQVVSPSSGATVYVGGYLRAHYNIFENPAIIYQLRVVSSWTSTSLPFSLNWWGTNIEEEVADSILDFYDDSLRAIAIYLPYLMSPEFNATTSNDTSTLHFVSSDDVVKGQLLEDYTFYAGEGPFNITGTLFVPQGKKLTIEEGVHFYCHPNAGKSFKEI
jgi:hypothetical protein